MGSCPEGGEAGAGKEKETGKHAGSEPVNPPKRRQEKQVMKGEFSKQFGKRLQKALNLRNCLFHATDSDLSRPGLRGITRG